MGKFPTVSMVSTGLFSVNWGNGYQIRNTSLALPDESHEMILKYFKEAGARIKISDYSRMTIEQRIHHYVHQNQIITIPILTIIKHPRGTMDSQIFGTILFVKIEG